MDWRRTIWVALLAMAALLPALGRSTRLSYHEAIVAQGAQEMLETRQFLVPTIGGIPWVEKPPLSHWLVAELGRLAGRIDSSVARLPSAAAALLLALAIGAFAVRRFGRGIGVASGALQATMAWWVTRGRLADADMVLTCLVALVLVVFDRLRQGTMESSDNRLLGAHQALPIKWLIGFFLLLGFSGLAKGVGFGPALVGMIVALVLFADRDARATRLVLSPIGLSVALGIALAWPICVATRYSQAASVWFDHAVGRFGHGRFAAEPWHEFALAPLVGLLPWLPFVAIGAFGSMRRSRLQRFGPDRLLWAWFLVPVVLVSCASSRNSHYLMPALPPCAVWGALGLKRVLTRLVRRGMAARVVRCASSGLIVAVALAWGAGYAVLGPWLDERGKGSEWAFYEAVGAQTPMDVPLVLVYDALDRSDRWDRAPYATPFGEVPADLAIRLFSLRRPARWCFGAEGFRKLLQSDGVGATTLVVIARERDRPWLEEFGEHVTMRVGPEKRFDRAFVAYWLKRP